MANAVISINVNITNSTGVEVTLDGRLRFMLGNPNQDGSWFAGWSGGPYIRTDNIWFSGSAVTMAPGETRTFSGLTWQDAESGCGLGGASPLSPSYLPIYADDGSIAYAGNVLMYTGSRSDVILCQNLSPNTVFTEGGVYDIVLSRVAESSGGNSGGETSGGDTSGEGSGSGGGTTSNDLTTVTDIVPVDSTYSGLSEKNLAAALTGKTLITNGNVIVLNFRRASAGAPLPYVGEVNNELVYFDDKGVSRDGTIKTSLATSTISNKNKQGDAQTRSSDNEEFVMNSLNYKEQVAVRILESIIEHEKDPLNYDDSHIKLMVAMAFRVAVEFQNRAVMFRQAESGGGGGGSSTEVEVSEDSLTNTTDKILYNINENLKNGIVVKGSTTATTPVNVKVTEQPNIEVTNPTNGKLNVLVESAEPESEPEA